MKSQLTLSQFNNRYRSEEDCLDEIVRTLFPNGITCRKCKRITSHYKLKGRKAYSCTFCRSQVHPLAGTIFEKSRTSLKTWFFAIFLMTQTRSGISAKTLQRITGVTYKTAWRMWKQIRSIMSEVDMRLLTGVVEIDETFVGGKDKNRKYRWNGGPLGKEIVMGMVERKGRVYLEHIETTGKLALLEQIYKHVSPEAHIMTDQYVGYKNLPKHGFPFHDSVDHEKIYVKGDVHTQNIENMWSHLKRGIFGVYRHVSKKYLQMYANEYAWRYNHRNDPEGMFKALLNQISLAK